MKDKLKIIVKLAGVGVFLYLFLSSICLMGASFKGFGSGFAEQLIRTTSNPFVGLFIGILATSLVQSSSTTTSIVVGMVSSGVITVGNAVYIVMGANIGTTVTNTLVSLGHITRREEFRRAIAAATMHDFFNFICVCVLLPIELATGAVEKCAVFMGTLFKNIGGIKFTSPLKAATEPAVHFIWEITARISELVFDRPVSMYILMLAFSALLLFLSLYFLIRITKSLVVKKAEAVIDNAITRSKLLGLLAGLTFTVVVQSSSVTTSLLVPLVAAGILTIEAAFSVTMGANIGTTTTAILASFATGDLSAIVVAFEHFLFNTIGVVIIFPIRAFRAVPINLAKALGDLAFKKRRVAVLYMLGVFFFVPALLIFISKYFR
ncbi:MAG TPA: Na/Pi symporter [Planctomycetes bacterium]|nr:Na/Pi symporter [Planctomycetota bacterium]HIJ70517.1 Na/Pi symporter [Planctomycetota bacterium]